MPVSINGSGDINGVFVDEFIAGIATDGDVLTYGLGAWGPAPSYSGPIFYAEADDAIQIDFSEDSIRSRVTDNAVTFTGVQYSEGKSSTIRVTSINQPLNLTFPSGWKFISFKPTTLDGNRTAILSVICFGTTESDVVAAWSSEA